MIKINKQINTPEAFASKVENGKKMYEVKLINYKFFLIIITNQTQINKF